MAEPKFVSDAHSLITAESIHEYGAVREGIVDADAFQAKVGQLALILEIAQQDFRKGAPAAATVERLAWELHVLRNACNGAMWHALIPLAQDHPVGEYLKQDPFTWWSAEKPRGYSGDASLLDIYYKHPAANDVIARSSELGREIYAYTSDAESSKAGRERRRILAETVDATAARTGGAEVLAIACGHLREAELSEAVTEGTVKRWVALDQDPESVALVERDHAARGITPIEGSVRGILRRAYDLGTFDLVYASGLYDYLTRPIGIRLLQRALEFVKPGGEFLFANFSDEITTDGYMETFMDWPLILRSADDMLDIINAAVDRNHVDIDVFYGSNRNIVYGKVIKHTE
ncbi:class I SAM-dependent methyltransferase [Pararhizobium mangrovi]|uniref:Class I SAM-dependent methyltransferase n=1 Tax=Pararhizobium mangrovi TaxID=2590452 RepID=A0A506U6W2_9HYPH|nr:class I SAM-dependent methyltransferase [Pararhizobium mangrovi]TPW29590.1 class I SAM-dependent methyltransferase [Pararhizobium mangrovi]